MISVNDDKDLHFRKAGKRILLDEYSYMKHNISILNAQFIVVLYPKLLEGVCSNAGFEKNILQQFGLYGHYTVD